MNDTTVDMTDDNEDLCCIHWGYLNVLHLSEVNGKKVKRSSWQTFWTDLCGTTLRLYKDTSLPSSEKNFPPSTLVGPRPKDEIKHAFFCLKQAAVQEFDANKYFQNLHAPRLSRKNTFQIILSDSSVYLLQAPTASALYRWLNKIQMGIDNGDELRDAKLAMYERRRHLTPLEPTYPEAPKTVMTEEEKYRIPRKDPRIELIKEKLREKKCLLRQLERQEQDFLGEDSGNEGPILRIEFAATTKKNYYLVPGRAETFIAAGKTLTVFGRLPNGRWRCCAERETEPENNGVGSDIGHVVVTYPYPLIGSIPTSAILELTQPSRIKDMVDSLSLSSSDTSDISIPETPPPDTPPLNAPPSPLWTTDPVPSPYSSHRSSSSDASQHSVPPTRPNNLTENLNQLMTRVILSSDSSTMSGTASVPDTPTSPSESSVVSNLNQALENLSLLTPRVRLSSGVSTCSANSTSSQEDSSSDMYRGSRLFVFDDNSPCVQTNTAVVVRRRKKRDIHITRKLHARGISLIVGSSSSSEDDDEFEERKKENNKRQQGCENHCSRKIEELHTSKEKLSEKGLKGSKSVTENTSKPPSVERGNLLDKPILNHDLLRDFSVNSCYGLPVRNSVTQAQFKPLSSHEIPPPLHQRRTLQMDRKEDEGFGFVLQTHSVVHTGSYADTMTFVSNVSEDGPAYLAGMRPGDVIIEIENANVEEDNQGMIVETLKNSGVTIRLVVVYKDAIRRMKLVTRLMALKARLKEAETAYEALDRKEQALKGRVEDPSPVDPHVQVAVTYIHIQTASTTFARLSADVKNTVSQNKRTPTELLQVKQPPLSDMSRMCGVPTTGLGLVREFASSCEDPHEGPTKPAISSKYASDTALNTMAAATTTMMKKRKTSEGSTKSKSLKQRSSFISYVDIDVENESRKRISSEGSELPSEDDQRNSEIFEENDEKVVEKATLSVQCSPVRPESYMFAVGTNSINAYPPLNMSTSPRPPGHSHECFDMGQG